MKKKSRKLLIIIGAVVGILFGAILLGISPLAKYYVEKHGKELIGRRVSVDQLRFNLLNGKLHIEDFTSTRRMRRVRLWRSIVSRPM